MFRSFEIPADSRAKLLLPFLTFKAKSLCSRLNAEELEDYKKFEILYCLNLKSLPKNIRRGLVMRTSVQMRHLFILLRGPEIIGDIICVPGTVWTILSVYFFF